MAQNDYDNKKDVSKLAETCRSKLRKLDDGNAIDGSGYTAQTWLNNDNEGEVGPHVTAWLNRLEAALANPVAHYTHVALMNDRNCGLDAALIAKLNAISVHVASIRP